MAGLSKLSTVSPLVRGSVFKCCNSKIVEQIRYGGHAPVFRKRPGILLTNRYKDALHFYTVGLGLLPAAIYLFFNYIIFGPCELTDWPEEGPPPRYWEFERTVPQQVFAKYIGRSDVEFHEANLAKNVHDAIIKRWRRLDNRVKHLTAERLDYKGFHYRPITTSWVEYGDQMRNRMSLHNETAGMIP